VQSDLGQSDLGQSDLGQSDLGQSEPGGDGRAPRHRLLETLRRYGLDRLEEAGQAPTFRDRHRDWFLALARAAGPQLSGPDQARWLDRLESERDNLRAALDWCLARDPDAALGFAAALWRFWWIRGHFREGRDLLERALAAGAGGADPEVRADALNSAGILAEAQGDYGAAVAHHEESLRLSRSAGNEAKAAESLNGLGNAASSQGEWDKARAHYEQALTIFRARGDEGRTAILLMNIGIVANHQQDHDRARDLYEQSLAIFRGRGDLGPLAAVLLNLGELACNQKDYPLARVYLRESLELVAALGERERIASVLITLGYAAWPLGEYDKAAWLFGAAAEMLSSLGVSLPRRDQSAFDENVATVRQKLGEPAFQDAWSRGSRVRQDQLVAEAF
jgi:non-specific serine/threonine protein kinase